MPRKRPANWDAVDVAEEPEPSRKRLRVSKEPPTSIRHPRIVYKPHTESGVGKDFHSVPYPLTLVPKKTWTALNKGQPEGAVCSQCGKSTPSSAHQRKLFLVAERLSWELGLVSRQMREDNEMALWAVNAELEIFEPAVMDEDVVVGGTKSRGNSWYPYAGEVEAELAMRIVSKAEVLTDASWDLWKDIPTLSEEAPQDRKDLGSSKTPIDLADEPGGDSMKTFAAKRRNNPQSALQELNPNVNSSQSYRKSGEEAVRPSPLPTPPSSIKLEAGEAATHREASSASSTDTLQDFYCQLDKIEQTSNMGAKFLEAYAERLHAEICKSCWFDKNVLEELVEDEPEMSGIPLSHSHPHGHPPLHQPSLHLPPGQPAHLPQPPPVMFGRPSALAAAFVHPYTMQHGTLPQPVQPQQPGSSIPPPAQYLPPFQRQPPARPPAPHPSTQGQFGMLIPQPTRATIPPAQYLPPRGPLPNLSQQHEPRSSGKRR